MIFYLEDNKKWSQLMYFFKACINGNSNICFMWNNAYGWMLMQNSEYLNNLDTDHLVLLAYFKIGYFSSFTKSGDLGLDTATFEMDITRIYQSLRSIRKTTKRVMFSLQKKNDDKLDTRVTFVMKIFDEDGTLEIFRDVYLNPNLNQQLYFNHIRSLSQENILYLEIQQNYLKNIKEFKNCILQMKFYEDHIHVEALNGEQDLVLQINRNICNNYNYSRIIQQFDKKNRLLIPPNFLISQIHLANKFNSTIELQFGDEVVGGRVIVYIRIKNVQFEIVSAFATVFDIDDESQAHISPFKLQQQFHQDDIQPNAYRNFNGNINNYQVQQQQNNNHQQNKELHQVQQQQKKSLPLKRDNENKLLDEINYDLNSQQYLKNNRNQNQIIEKPIRNNQQMIPEQQKYINNEIPKIIVHKETKAVMQTMNDRNNYLQNKNSIQMQYIQNNVINKGMEVETSIENLINKRKNKNKSAEMLEFDNGNLNDLYTDYDDDIMKNNRNRGGVMLQHLQDEFSSILQEGNQNRSLLSSSIRIDSRKQTAQQNGKQQIHQDNILQMINQQPENNNQLKINQKYPKNIGKKFFTEEKIIMGRDGEVLFEKHHLQKNENIAQQKISLVQLKNKQKIKENYHMNQQGLSKQIPVNNNMEEEIDKIDENHPNKNQKINDMINKKIIFHNNDTYPNKDNRGENQASKDIYQLQQNYKQKSSLLNKFNEIQPELQTKNQRNIRDMEQITENQYPQLQIDQTIKQNSQSSQNEDLKNKLFKKNELKKIFYQKQDQQQSLSTSPEQQRYHFKLPTNSNIQNQNTHLFDQNKNIDTNKINNKVGVVNYLASIDIQDKQMSDPPSQNENNISKEALLKSKLLQRNQENLEMLKREQILHKTKKTTKTQQKTNNEGLFENQSISQMVEELPINSTYTKGFLQITSTKKQQYNSSQSSEVPSSQKIIQISHETSGSYHILQPSNLIKPKELFKQVSKDQQNEQNPKGRSQSIENLQLQNIQAPVHEKQGLQYSKEKQKDNLKEINPIINSYKNPLQTNYNSSNAVQTNQYQLQSNQQSGEISSDIQRDRFEQYQNKQNQERQYVGNQQSTLIDIKSSSLLKSEQQGVSKVQNNLSPNKNSKLFTATNKLNENPFQKTNIDTTKPTYQYSFQEPLAKQNINNQQKQQQIQQEQLNQSKTTKTDSALRENSFANFLKQNEKKDDFSIFSIKKPSQASVIEKNQEKVINKGFEFQLKQNFTQTPDQMDHKVENNKKQ